MVLCYFMSAEKAMLSCIKLWLSFKDIVVDMSYKGKYLRSSSKRAENMTSSFYTHIKKLNIKKLLNRNKLKMNKFSNESWSLLNK